MGEGDIVLSFAGVADEDGAVVVGLEDAIHFAEPDFELVEKFVDIGDTGQVGGVFAVGIFDDVGVGRMGEDEVYGVVLTDGQVAHVADADALFGVVFDGKVEAFLGNRYGIGIDVESHGAAVEQAGFDEGGAAAHHRVEDEFALGGIVEDDVAGNLGGKVAAIVAFVGCPVAADGKVPDGGAFSAKFFEGLVAHWVASVVMTGFSTK